MGFIIHVNGTTHSVDVDGKTPLLFVLRNDLSLKGAKLGCGAGNCGACTVIVNGRAVQSCSTPMWGVDGADIVTLEGLGDSSGRLDPIQQAFLDLQAAQCAYCIPGIIMTLRALFERHPDVSDTEIRTELAERHLCRCGTHARILKAARAAADSVREQAGREKTRG